MAHARIMTPDPAFTPDKPVYLNGFLFVPAIVPCPGHQRLAADKKVCRFCGTHVDEER